jgi:3-phenylpropionate/trans-cinnamate dioxygenase ferredoxin reductase subunit
VHAYALAAELRTARHLVVVGGGLIGLEVAASAADLGVEVTVIEVLPRILARVCDAETAARVDETHRRHGVDIRLGTALTHAEMQSDGRIALRTGAGETLVADAVVVGAGAIPDDRLAAAAGLATDNGILVDARCATSDPKIFAAGDVVRFPGPQGVIRREDWRHAQDQGAVAGRNAARAAGAAGAVGAGAVGAAGSGATAAGAGEEYRSLPSFWSEQFDLYIQGVGTPPLAPDARVRRTGPGTGAIAFETAGPHIAYALGINAQRDIALTRRLIERRIAVDPAALADPTKPLADFLKAKQA